MAEGAQVIGRALAAGHRPRSILVEGKRADEARELLRAAWREAAEQMFQGPDLDLVRAEIDIMIDSLDMTEPPPPMPRSEMH